MVSKDGLKEPGNGAEETWAKAMEGVPKWGERSRGVEQEKEYVEFSEMRDYFNDAGSVMVGHGIGSSGGGEEVIESIFNGGVKGFLSEGNMNSDDEVVGSTDITDNMVALFSAAYGDEVDMGKMREKLDNWPHRAEGQDGRKNEVVLVKLPLEYFNNETNVGAEKTAPFFTQIEEEDGRKRNSLRREFIVGAYDPNTGRVELNPYFEDPMSEELKAEMGVALEAAKEATRKRNEANEEFLGASDESWDGNLDNYYGEAPKLGDDAGWEDIDDEW